MLVTTTWNRARQGRLAWSGALTLAQASSTPALAGESVIGTMERLRDGPVYELAAARENRRRRMSLSWRGETMPVRWLGLRHHPEFGTSASLNGVQTKGTGHLGARRARRRRAGAGVAILFRRGSVALERDRSGAVGDRRDCHHVADRRRSRAACVHGGRLTRGREPPLEHTVAQHPRNVSRHQQRLADVPRRLRGVRRTAAAQLPGLRRSACPDRVGPSLERRQLRPHSPGR